MICNSAYYTIKAPAGNNEKLLMPHVILLQLYSDAWAKSFIGSPHRQMFCLRVTFKKKITIMQHRILFFSVENTSGQRRGTQTRRDELRQKISLLRHAIMELESQLDGRTSTQSDNTLPLIVWALTTNNSQAYPLHQIKQTLTKQQNDHHGNEVCCWLCV